MEALLGKWTHTKSENFEDFLKENGANFVVRKVASKTNPTMEIGQDGSKITIKLILPIQTQEESFTLGEEFETVFHQNNQKCKGMGTIEDGKLVVEYTPLEGEEGKGHKIVRSAEGDELTMVMTVGDVVCTRTFKKE